MKSHSRALSLVAAAVTVGALCAGPAAASPADFFQCAPGNGPYLAQQPRGEEGRNVFYERCWSPVRGAWMYRGRVLGALPGDMLRIAYRPYTNNRWVEHSARVAPQDVNTAGEMPGEWYLAADNGNELQACLSIGGTTRIYCTWP